MEASKYEAPIINVFSEQEWLVFRELADDARGKPASVEVDLCYREGVSKEILRLLHTSRDNAKT